MTGAGHLIIFAVLNESLHEPENKRLSMRKTRIGLMGFGEIGRHLYRLILDTNDCEVVAISDIGKPEILHYLLEAELRGRHEVKLEGQYLVSSNGKARLFQVEKPADMPWDLFDVDFVVDSTRKFWAYDQVQAHLQAGAKRVIISSLPQDKVDRLILPGVNGQEIRVEDRVISVGSGTTNATALMLKVLDDAFGVEAASFTVVHEYTGDQALRDVASSNPRRSRSAVENIIPNQSPSAEWIIKVMPQFEGRIEGSALNVPVPAGSMLDLTTVFKTEKVTVEQVLTAMASASAQFPEIIKIEEDEIVSTDVIGRTETLLFDKNASMAGKFRMFKSIAWYHNTLAMAARIKDVILQYSKLDSK
jgi:glyceraldehyde 3-phosphate dehydrogenase